MTNMQTKNEKLLQIKEQVKVISKIKGLSKNEMKLLYKKTKKSLLSEKQPS